MDTSVYGQYVKKVDSSCGLKWDDETYCTLTGPCVYADNDVWAEAKWEAEKKKQESESNKNNQAINLQEQGELCQQAYGHYNFMDGKCYCDSDMKKLPLVLGLQKCENGQIVSK